MMAAVLEDVTVAIHAESGPLPLIEHVSMTVQAGQVLGIVGETGAGKTVTMRALLDLLPSEMHVDGLLELRTKHGESITEHRRGKAGFVFQNPAAMFDPMMRVGKQLIEGVTYSGETASDEAGARARSLLGQMGFPEPADIMHLYPHQLSGGMVQRAAIAMAMMPEPALMVVDEPTSALDANLRVEILTLLRDMAVKQEMAIMLVSHDLNLVGRFCDTLVVMYAGRVVERGATAQVLGQPRHPYTSALIATAPSVSSQPFAPLPTISGAPPSPGEWPPGCVFEPRCPLAFEKCVRSRPSLDPERTDDAACHLVS